MGVSKDFLSEACVDLTDGEIAAVGRIWQEIMTKWSRRANTHHNIAEMCKEIEDCLFKAGLICQIDVSGLIAVPPQPPVVAITGRVPGSIFEDEIGGIDHERKRHDVLEAKARGEAYRGQKERTR